MKQLGKVLASATASIAVCMMFNGVAFAATKTPTHKPVPVKKDKNIATYLNGVDTATGYVNTMLVEVDAILADIENNKDCTSDYNNLNNTYNKYSDLTSGLGSGNIPIKGNKAMELNQEYVTDHQSDIYGDVFAFLTDVEYGIGSQVQYYADNFVDDVKLLQSPYYATCAEMKAYGIKPVSIKLPNDIQNLIDNTPDSFNVPDSSDSSSSAPTVGFTYANFQQIDSTYTVDEVNQLFGMDGTLSSETNDGTDDITIYTWQNSDGTKIVTVEFDNGQEVDKDQVGLS